MKVQFGAWEPDKAPFLTTGLYDMEGAYPTANGYRPVGQFQAIADPLPTPFNGGDSFVDSLSDGTLLAGSSSHLYKYVAGGWTSLVSGLTLTSRWQFTQFGDFAIAVNGAATYQANLLAGTAAVLTGAPTATSVATIGDFVVYGGANGNAALVQWSAFNDQTGNTPGTDQAGFQPMLDGGNVMGLAGGEYGLIIQRNTVRKMTYIGVAQGDVTIPFQFDVISPNVGAISAGSIAQVGRVVYFLSDRGFMSCDGTDVTPIGTERVDSTFFKLYSRDQLDQMYAAIDPRRTTVTWIVPGTPGRVWVYNWSLDKWSDFAIGAKAILPGFTASIGLEQLDALYPGGLETIPYSLDSMRFAGGEPLFFVVANDNTIGTLSGDNMAASFSTPFMELIEGRRARLRFIRPLTDAIAGVSAILDVRQQLGGPEEIQTRATLNSSGNMPVRKGGRYVKTTIEIEAGADWTYILGFEPVAATGGGR